jgi:sulfatase modifying factor 1
MRTRVSWGRSLLLLLGLAVLAGPASAVTIDWVVVGDPGNAADTPSTNCYAANCGSVADPYLISKYEVTNAQYAEFLNLKAAADPLTLYNTNMGSNAQGGIARSGISGGYTYTVKPGFADKPVNYVSFYDSLRFTNWLNNGQGSADTETGAYTLLGGTATPSNGTTVLRNPGANIFLPSENEWYKAAYYDGLSATYFDYPAGTNTPTVCAAPTGAANRANCNFAVGGLTNVGAYTGSASPYGTFDQGGNVAEWNEQIDGSRRGFRGGNWIVVAGSLAASLRTSNEPIVEGDGFGFRVASVVPEPGTGLLLMAGLAGVAARQQRRKRRL